ncbi:hypothetical protein CTAYLR_006381 [Chrysophaeum taylorii]|uniref:Transglutaminase-like domain-containing protein n=1 Tax=Chrysophaeum taylorii TaxID=2483200 RepID=A0AAD7U6J6_9STRA|nr:hypothetical protein CTAYLR_006381 [Chrysophaeum taylorii]
MRFATVVAPCVPFGNNGSGISCVTQAVAIKSATSFLVDNMPPMDEPNKATLFDDGVAAVGVNASVAAKATYPWAAAVPQDIFDEYVASYALLNEPRTDWRPFLEAVVAPLVENLATAEDAIAMVNGYVNSSVSVWKSLGVSFKSSQTPLIFDPLSTAAYGYASCTGISAMFVAALRSIAIPARVVGTPAWRGDAENGNHNWVEIWNATTGAWDFIEGRPSGGGETLTNPCDKWFCNPSKFPTTPNNATPVFAARFDRHTNLSVYELAWDPTNLDVPGENRSDYYMQACSQC